jgi:hypothetical protein
VRRSRQGVARLAAAPARLRGPIAAQAEEKPHPSRPEALAEAVETADVGPEGPRAGQRPRRLLAHGHTIAAEDHRGGGRYTSMTGFTPSWRRAHTITAEVDAGDLEPIPRTGAAGS